MMYDTFSDVRFKTTSVAIQPIDHDYTIGPSEDIFSGDLESSTNMFEQLSEEVRTTEFQLWNCESLDGCHLSLGSDKWGVDNSIEICHSEIDDSGVGFLEGITKSM